MRALFQALALALLFAAGVQSPAMAQAQGVRGDAAAVAAAQRLVDNAGGAEAWRSRTFEVEERGYFTRTGEVGQLRITRELARGARRLENVTPSRRVVEWLSPEGGWTSVNGAVTPMSAAELAVELQGLRQEPYSIFHRVARNDPALRVELREDGRLLMVYDSDERVLCWFQLDPAGAIVGWGNYFEGAINQHYYGPVADMGDVNLPRWGAASNGSFRFEYVSARMSNAPLPEPSEGRRQ